MYIGRFAPSPTGPLHFGSLVAALASWLDARAAHGRWLLRIEDLDAPRAQPGAAEGIARTLGALGLHWDGAMMLQSRRSAAYRAALEKLSRHTYACGCSRREIADSSLGVAPDGALVYPGVCRAGLPPGRAARAIRVRTAGAYVEFVDRVQGRREEWLERTVGDFILHRADSQFAYQLAVVVDDAGQNVTDVVRGADLLDSTARQIHLQRLLGVPQPRYLHVPAALNAAGEKLSKQSGAQAVDPARGWDALRSALRFLGQREAQSLAQAITNWDPGAIPARRTLRAE